MEIFIYFFSKLSTSLDVIEDALDELLDGAGEVTGTGMGESGSNIDIEIFEGDPVDYIESIREVLKGLQVPDDMVIEVDDEKYRVY